MEAMTTGGAEAAGRAETPEDYPLPVSLAQGMLSWRINASVEAKVVARAYLNLRVTEAGLLSELAALRARSWARQRAVAERVVEACAELMESINLTGSPGPLMDAGFNTAKTHGAAYLRASAARIVEESVQP